MNVAEAQADLIEKLSRLGWTLSKVDFTNGTYAAKGAGPGGEKIERTGNTPEMAIAALIHFAVRANGVRQYAARSVVAAWKGNWVNMSDEIAQAYSEMPAFDEKAVPAWKALAAESKIQADSIKRQIDVEVSHEPEPYKTTDEMCEDVHKKHHLTVSKASTDHPIWSAKDVINFRIVHDVLGVCQSGGNYSWVGSNLATAQHMPLLSPLAREALFVENIAKPAYNKHYRGHGPQKIGLMNQYLHPVQDDEGDHVFIPHGATPQTSSKDPGEWKAPSDFDPVQASIDQANALTFDPPAIELGWHFAADTETDPDYIFVYYMSQLKIEPWHHNRSQSDMFEEMLAANGTNVQGIGNDFDSADVATGLVYKEPGGAIRVEQEGFVKPDVDLLSRLAVRNWLNEGGDTTKDEDSNE